MSDTRDAARSQAHLHRMELRLDGMQAQIERLEKRIEDEKERRREDVAELREQHWLTLRFFGFWLVITVLLAAYGAFR